MESARSAVSSFLGRGGHQETEVDETVNPAVTSETVKPHRHEEVTQAVDREVHQDHYHTTVQPLQAKEVLPEQHVHNMLPTEERTFQHGNPNEIQERIAAESGQFRDSSVVHDTTHSQSAASAVTGEHIHHHVHEVVQPVVHKETIQPETVHTVVPVHETHYAPSEHHGMSSLPVRTLDEFKGMGGSVNTGSHSREEYEGHPKPYNAGMQVERRPVDIDPMAHDGPHDLKSTGHVVDGSSNIQSGGTSAALAGAAAAPHLGSHSHHSGHKERQEHSHHHTDQDGSHVGSGTLTGAAATGLGHQHGTHTSSESHGHSGTANKEAMGAGVAGVGAGAAAADLGRDHVRAGQNTDMTSRDVSSTGGAGSNVTGTSLGGRTEGNTVGGASEHAHSNLQGSQREPEREPSNLTGGKSHDAPVRDGVQSEAQGKDPALVGDKNSKLTGSGVDGSHSAVFGLTPDGHTYDDTHNTSTSVKPAHSKESEINRSGNSGNDSSSRGAGGSSVADQINDPRVAEKGHGGDAVSSTSNTKPGAGMVGGSQGTGDVRPGENN